MPVTLFSRQILKQVRSTAAFSILFAAGFGEHIPEDHEFRRRLARIVEQFKDDGHWENFMAIAWSRHVDQRYNSAVKFYRRAVELIEEDDEVCSDPTWQERVQYIECLKRCARHQQLPDKAMLRSVLGWSA